MLTPQFWTATTERAVKTAAQTLVALIGVDQVGVLELDWPAMLSVTATATILSVLTSIASSPIGVAGPGLSAETIENTTALNEVEQSKALDQDALDAALASESLDDEEGYEPEPAEDAGEAYDVRV